MPYEFYNDVHLIPNYLIIFSTAILILFCAMAFHELGHYLYFLIKKKKKIQIRYVKKEGFLAGHPEDYKVLSDKEYVMVNWSGILFGILPIGIAGIFANPIFWLIIVGYLIGCKDDIKNIISRVEWEDGYN